MGAASPIAKFDTNHYKSKVSDSYISKTIYTILGIKLSNLGGEAHH